MQVKSYQEKQLTLLLQCNPHHDTDYFTGPCLP